MLKSKQQFVKITKKGSLVKVVREHYLRDDIPCGLMNCQKCSGFDGYKAIIDPALPILVLDTNIILHQIDILENSSVKNAILCSTVMEETRHRNRSKYERLRKLVQQEEKRFFVFSNEHHRETYVPQQIMSRETENSTSHLSANDRNDLAIRNVFKWLLEHSPTSRIMFLSDDVQNRQLAKEQISSADVFSMEQYLKEFLPELLDQLSLDNYQESSSTATFTPYPEHLPLSVVQVGIERKIYFSGTLNVSSYNVLEGSIFSDSFGQEIFIVGREHMNRAIHGDLIALELLPQEQWKSATEEVIIEEADDVVEGSSDETETKRQRVESTSNRLPTGKVVAILKKNWRGYCGSIKESASGNSTGSAQSILFVPVDRRIPIIRIQTRQLANLIHKRIIVTVDSWPTTSKYPLGHYKETVGTGQVGNLSTETEVVLIEHDVPYEPFAPIVTDCLPKEGANWRASEQDFRERADFRSLLICSIDPPGCTDIDDALHARPLDPSNPSGHWEIGVHIADVTHFVKPSTPLDQEAAHRATSVYLVDRRIDMLPELLGSDLCSLHCNVERLAFSVVWVVDQNGAIHDCKFTKSIIQSKRSFTYDQAQLILDDPNSTDELAPSLNFLYHISQLLRKKRMDSGALTLASPEVRFKLADGEGKDPTDVEVKEMKGANALVEEFMLLANISVAERIYRNFPEHSLLRRHPIPPQSNFDNLVLAINAHFTNQSNSEHPVVPLFDPATNKSLSESLDRVVDSNDNYFNTLVRILTTRCMMQAVYFVSGNCPYPDFYHYGLATPIYTHFTSPIRRYADIIVHRLLASTLSNEITSTSVVNSSSESVSLSKSSVTQLCDNLNFRHRMAQYASRASIELFTCIYFKSKLSQAQLVEDAYVIKVCKNGFVAFVPKYGVEGLVDLNSELTNGTLVFDPERFTLSSINNNGTGKEVIRLFQHVRVQITVIEVNLRTKLRMILLDSK